eukprot:Hpha_TRINITY_DN13344_c0_g1::TRINITY_DN13344_c0_g1_i1::g.95407::m.95407/K11412/SIRT2, SIR2L2; NAD-dependent deacetylase sirtuin 2
MGGGASVPEPDSLPEKDRKAVLGGDRTLQGIAKWLTSTRCSKVVVAVGAGMSCSAGIPDFRTPGTGLYDNLQEYNLPTPQSVFDLGFFQENPEPFCRLARELFPGGYAPTPGHAFVRLLHEKGKLLRCFTQNIDNLERLAGIPPESLVEAHGSFSSAGCLACGKDHDPLEIKATIDKKEIPRCGATVDIPPPQAPLSEDEMEPILKEYAGAEEQRDAAPKTLDIPKMMEAASRFGKAKDALEAAEKLKREYPTKRAEWEAAEKQYTCDGLVKPRIVFFGESLPKRFHFLSTEDCAEADLMIVVGTSLGVMPFAGIISKTGPLCPRLLVNRDPAGLHDDEKYGMSFGNFGFRFHRKDNYRDVFAQGTCDDQLRLLAKHAGWGADLAAIEKDISRKGKTLPKGLFTPLPPWGSKEEALLDGACTCLRSKDAFAGAERYEEQRRSSCGGQWHLLPPWRAPGSEGGEPGMASEEEFRAALRGLFDTLGCPPHWRAIADDIAQGRSAPARPAPAAERQRSGSRKTTPPRRSSSGPQRSRGSSGKRPSPPPKPASRKSPPKPSKK